MSNMTALGIPTITAPGESFHIDWINATENRETLIGVASKSYLDWYMLTQVRARPVGLLGLIDILSKLCLYCSTLRKSLHDCHAVKFTSWRLC